MRKLSQLNSKYFMPSGMAFDSSNPLPYSEKLSRIRTQKGLINLEKNTEYKKLSEVNSIS